MYDCLPLKLCGDLGQILFHPFNLRDEESIRKCIKYSNVVINLIGRDWETRNFNFRDVHVEGARRLARLCKEANVERFIHLSALNVSDKLKVNYILFSSYEKISSLLAMIHNSISLISHMF